ncbi:MAG TPA: hypothetical protein PKM88_07885 [bacterium]|nr:hypothetical protein [bacterium]
MSYTPRHVVAVWTGNFDGAPMRDCSGVTGAAPLWQAVMRLVGAGDGSFAIPATLSAATICPLSGGRVGPACPGSMREWFHADAMPSGTCDFHRRSGAGIVEQIPIEYCTDGYRTR